MSGALILDLDLTSQAGRDEAQAYLQPRVGHDTGVTYDPGNVLWGTDGLRLRTQFKGGAWTAAQVHTRGTLEETYGRFEVTARVMVKAGTNVPELVPGYQSTFFLVPVDPVHYGYRWPESGEVDFAEFFSSYPGVVKPTVHYPLRYVRGNDNRYTGWTTLRSLADVHTYSCVWIPGRVTCGVDGQAVVSDDYHPSNVDAPAPFDRPFYLALTSTIGSGSDAPRPGTTQAVDTVVERIRVWD